MNSWEMFHFLINCWQTMHIKAHLLRKCLFCKKTCHDCQHYKQLLGHHDVTFWKNKRPPLLETSVRQPLILTLFICCERKYHVNERLTDDFIQTCKFFGIYFLCTMSSQIGVVHLILFAKIKLGKLFQSMEKTLKYVPNKRSFFIKLPILKFIHFCCKYWTFDDFINVSTEAKHLLY